MPLPAVVAYPELYFTRFVILVEGDSERVVLPKLANVLELALDPSFISIVPLGGRHVEHFWRLLTDLGIPFATLLDLDIGRSGGGYGRIKTAIKNLIAIDVPPDDLLIGISAEDFELMHTWDIDDRLDHWLSLLEQHGVFYNRPLDLDLTLIANFPDLYEALIPETGGPRGTNADAVTAVLGAGGSGEAAYSGDLRPFLDHFLAYRYHFIGHSKPATHIEALSGAPRPTIASNIPSVISSLFRFVFGALEGAQP